METEFQTERQDLSTAHQRHRKDLGDVLEAMQQEFLGERERERTRDVFFLALFAWKRFFVSFMHFSSLGTREMY